MYVPYFGKRIVAIAAFFLISAFSTSFAQCIPPASICNDFHQYIIDSVSFVSIHNQSGCSTNGYTDYTSSISAPTVTTGTYVPMTVKVGSGTLTKGVSVGIDFNHNGTFEYSERLYLGQDQHLVSNLIRIPYGASLGTTLVRIRVTDYSYSAQAQDMCNGYQYAETEDYHINVIASANAGPDFSFYVNKLATGTNDGSSWANAFTELSSALNFAKGRDTIRVAANIYKPGTTAAATFRIKDSLVILGGYPNSGNPTDAIRNFSSNQTILSGELGTSSYNDNSSTIVSAYYYSSQEPTNNFILDGFILEAAAGNALKLSGVDTAQVRNCVFRNNNNYGEGSAISCTNSNPLFLNCYFHKNDLGSISVAFIQASSAPTFANCVFAENKHANSILHATQGNPKLINCDFVNNQIEDYYTFNAKLLVGENNSSFSIANSIFYRNYFYGIYGLTTDSVEISLANSVADFHNTITQSYNTANAVFFGADPKFADTARITGNDNLYFTADDGLHLVNPCSPAINAGLNTYANGISKDIESHPRIFGTVVDLGPYEIQTNQGVPPATLYVNSLAAGTNNGTSWANAYTNLQDALKGCSDTIRIAAGTYYPSTTDERVSFWLQNNRVMLGGYPATGNPTDDQRDPIANPTILSGNILDADHRSQYVVRARSVDSTAKLNGLIISDASVASIGDRAGIYIDQDAYPEIDNCRIMNNYIGIKMLTGRPLIKNCIIESNVVPGYVTNATPIFLKCNFLNNTTNSLMHERSNSIIDSCNFQNNFGAIVYLNCSHPKLLNSYFSSNIGFACVYSDNSSAEITNSVFIGQTVYGTYAVNGGIIANVNLSAPVITNCEFRKGHCVSNGGICYNDNSSPVFKNCILNDSQARISGGAIYNTNQSNATIINCIGSNNYAYSEGTFMMNDNSTASIINSTIVNNGLHSDAGGGVGALISNQNGIITIDNSILWGNRILNYLTASPIEIQGSGITVKNSLTQVFGTNGINGNIVGINPRLIDINNPAGGDGLFFTADDGLRLCSCSPAIDKAANTILTTIGITTDILDAPRVFNATADMGPYEFQSTLTTQTGTFYVKESATGSNNGSSWDNAYKELSSAIQNTCSDTIKVAMGIYKPSVNSKDSTFYVDRGLTIWGGYPNSGNPEDSDRNPDTYSSILSGDVGIQGDSTDNSYSVMIITCEDTSVNVQGLTFKYGNAIGVNSPLGTNNAFGGGLYATANKNLLIRNCRFYNNFSLFGSALYVRNNTVVDQCVFNYNTGVRGTLYTYGTNVAVKNSFFGYNYAHWGSGILSTATGVYGTINSKFDNLVFYKNTVLNSGAGMYLSENPGDTITNCNFISNSSVSGYIGVDLINSNTYFVTPSNPVIRNCIFKGAMLGTTLLNNENSDWAWVSGSYGLYSEALNLRYSATVTNVPYYSSTNISPSAVSFANVNDPIGPDGVWFTADDGLRPDGCSGTIDRGINTAVTQSTDMIGQTRIYNAIVDIGAFEYQGSSNPTINITASQTAICSGAAVTFDATTTLAGTNPTYQWQINGVNAGTNNPQFISNTLNNNDQVTCIITSNASCLTSSTATSNIISITINSSVAPSVTINSTANSICAGTSVSFTATAVNGGTSASYQWQVNGINLGTNSPTFTNATLVDNDRVAVILTSSISCAVPSSATSNIIAITVIPIPIANAGNDVVICSGGSVQLHGTGGSSYLWTPAVGLSDPNIADPVATPVITTIYTLNVSNGSCTASDQVIVTVQSVLVPSVSITSSANQVCIGDNILFTAAAVNAGTGASYQWQVNGINQGTNSATYLTSALNDNDAVGVILSITGLCASPNTAISNQITMHVTVLDEPIISLNNSTLSISNPMNGVSYIWQLLNNGLWENIVPVATGTSFTVAQPGEYRVKASVAGCSAFSQSHISARQGNIILYPNPVTNIVTLDKIDPANNWETLKVVNILGQQVFPTIDIHNRTTVTLKLDYLNQGVYFIKLNGQGNKKTVLSFVKG